MPDLTIEQSRELRLWNLLVYLNQRRIIGYQTNAVQIIQVLHLLDMANLALKGHGN